MLLIKHYIAASPIHGLGVFAAESAQKGQLVWSFHALIDREIPSDALASVPAHVAHMIRRHAEFLAHRDCFRLAADGDFFMNHSIDASLRDGGDAMFATRDIHPGDELTCDYREIRVLAFEDELALSDRSSAQTQDAAWPSPSSSLR